MSRRRNARKNCCGDLVTHMLRLRFTPEELEQRDKSRKIDKFLEKDKNSFRRQVNIKISAQIRLYLSLITFPTSPSIINSNIFFLLFSSEFSTILIHHKFFYFFFISCVCCFILSQLSPLIIILLS